jgi:CRISPR/Cas system-associated endonuclease Cas1
VQKLHELLAWFDLPALPPWLCSFLHADKQFRDSLVYDLMELYRPAVDALVPAFLARTTFAYGDMVRASTGQCMLHPQLARAVVAACRLDQERVSAGAQQLREMLVQAVVSTRPIL